MLKVLIVDDEPLARDRLVRMISELDDFQVIGEATTGLEAIEATETLCPDVVLMDICMPDMDGITAAQHLKRLKPPPAVIFCTAYDDYALEAFSSAATGYLMKPVKRNNLAAALSRAQHVNRAQLEALSFSQSILPECREHVISKNSRGVALLAIADIRLFQADSKYVTAHHVQGEALLDETLKGLAEEFAADFVRIHRNALISLSHIEGLERSVDGQYFARLAGVTIKPLVSRRHVAELRNLLEKL